MELNWSTFALEIINFLILVWLLARFLYRPVLDIIDRRKQEINKQLADADTVRKVAESLKQDYQDRMQVWNREQSEARKRLHDAIAAERQQLLEDLRHDLELEREKAAILNKRRLEDEKSRIFSLTVQQGAEFCAKLLARLAGPELEASIINVAVADLEALAQDRLEALKKNHGSNNNIISITSAFPLTAEQKKLLEQKLRSITRADAGFNYQQDPDLLAGVRIRIGAWQLQANLQDELQYFTGQLPAQTADES